MKIHYLDKDLLSFYSEIPDCNWVVIFLDTEYLLQEKTQELTFEDFKGNIQSQFK